MTWTCGNFNVQTTYQQKLIYHGYRSFDANDTISLFWSCTVTHYNIHFASVVAPKYGRVGNYIFYKGNSKLVPCALLS